MQNWFFDSPDPDHTAACAVALGQAIGADGLVIALVGPLGAGKTVFVKGLAEGLGVDARLVSSPTFVIAQQYPLPRGPETLHHVDLYRLESAGELEPLGFDDMLGKGQVLVVEWADRFPEVLGKRLLRIEFEGPSPAEEDAAREGVDWRGRRAQVTAQGEDAESVLGDWAERVESLASSSGRATGGRRPSADAGLLLMLLLGLFSFFGSQIDLLSRPSACGSLVAQSSDALGTLYARCQGEGQGVSQPLTGIGRLLTGNPINLNRASASLLETLPQIGATRAAAIVHAREARPQGRFSAVEELTSIHGIGPKTLERIERWLYVSASASASASPSTSAVETSMRSPADELTNAKRGVGAVQPSSMKRLERGGQRNG